MTFLYRLLVFLTPTFDGKKSTNNVFFATVKRDSPHYAAVRLQEQIESAFTKMVAGTLMLITGAGGVFLAGPTGAMAALAGLVAGVFLLQTGKGVEQVELRGQSFETWIRHHIYGEDYDAAEMSNAQQITSGRYADRGAFKGKTPVQVKAELRKWRPWAARMGKAFEPAIRKAVARGRR